MSIREFFLENFAGDLEYHPRRAALYLVLAIAAAALWFFSPTETEFTATPLVFALGALTLLTKGIFLFRRSSEGLGLHQGDLACPILQTANNYRPFLRKLRKFFRTLAQAPYCFGPS